MISLQEVSRRQVCARRWLRASNQTQRTMLCQRQLKCQLSCYKCLQTVGPRCRAARGERVFGGRLRDEKSGNTIDIPISVQLWSIIIPHTNPMNGRVFVFGKCVCSVRTKLWVSRRFQLPIYTVFDVDFDSAVSNCQILQGNKNKWIS